MTTDKELAERVVALGVGEKDTFRPYMYTLGKFESVRYEADKFVCDWRVAGALIEKVLDAARYRRAAWRRIDPQGGWNQWMVKPMSIPRSVIIECVAWLGLLDDPS